MHQILEGKARQPGFAGVDIKNKRVDTNPLRGGTTKATNKT